MNQILNGNKNIRGVLLESHLESGSQNLTSGPGHLKYGVSVTDACLDWNCTEQLLLENARLLSESSNEDLKNKILYAVAN